MPSGATSSSPFDGTSWETVKIQEVALLLRARYHGSCAHTERGKTLHSVGVQHWSHSCCSWRDGLMKQNICQSTHHIAPNNLQVGQQVRDHDLEDRIDDAAESFFGGLWRIIRVHGWSIADRIFKITAWTMLVGVIQALYRETELEGLQVIANVLFVVLLLGVAITIMNVMIFFQDQASEKILFLASAGWRFLVMLGISALLIVLGFMLILPTFIVGVDQVLTALSFDSLAK